LKNIEKKLDILVDLQKRTLPKQSVTKEERKVLNLCDKKHTAEDIAKATGKTETNVNYILSSLRNKFLIQSVKVDGKTVYEKI
jgi:DNA-binding transcriptional ArsR family regulator